MRLNKLVMGTVLALAAAASNAATFSFAGDIATQKDVVIIPFSLDADATNVKVWTDSYLGGTNFDPITAVWQGNGTLIAQNDDDPNIAPGQTVFDSGLTFATLAKGSYFFTIATYNNFAKGTNMSDGFRFDADAAVPLQSWCQPSSHCGMGTHFSVHLDGVDGASAPVPEPSTYAMLLAGLAIVPAVARRQRKKQA
jgi:hypothetical protein